ncbi:Os11g0286500, partial [Oryza sativa Japonica Group]
KIGNMRKETNAGYMVTDGLVIAAGSSWATNSMEGWQKNRDRVSSLDDETLSRQGVARR